MKLFIFIFFSVVNLFAVVTIAPVEIGKKSALSGIFKGSLETKRGNSDINKYSAGFRLQYDANNYVVWSDLVLDYGEASGVKNTNKSYAHLRLIHKILDIEALNYEVFVQSEFNEFTNVKDKLLLGGGIRYHDNLKAYGDLYFGVGAFRESIRYLTNIDANELNVRGNTYISYIKKFTKTTKVSYVMYYQPNLRSFSDSIFLSALELEVSVYKGVYLNFVFYYDVDTKPGIGIDTTDISQKTSLMYKF